MAPLRLHPRSTTGCAMATASADTRRRHGPLAVNGSLPQPTTPGLGFSDRLGVELLGMEFRMYFNFFCLFSNMTRRLHGRLR